MRYDEDDITANRAAHAVIFKNYPDYMLMPSFLIYFQESSIMTSKNI
jgi:hypothetical protein